MGRRRKSDRISQKESVNVVDLTEIYEIEDDASSVNSQNESDNRLKTSKDSRHVRLSCDFCTIKHRKCDLQKPTCGRCQEITAFYRPHKCVYSGEFARILRSRAKVEDTILTERPAVEEEEVEIEVIDLESDTDNVVKDDHEKGEYEVEAILGRRQTSKTVQYLVKWKGYPDSWNTWEPVKSLKKAKGRIKDFNAIQNAKNRPVDRKVPVLQKPHQQAPTELKASITHSTPPAKTSSSEPSNSSNTWHIWHPSPAPPSKRIPEDVNFIMVCRSLSFYSEYEYLADWKGLTPQDRSWETESKFSNHKRIVQFYHLGYPDVTSTSSETRVPPPLRRDWFSEDTHRIRSSRRMAPDENPEYLVTEDGGNASWHTSEQLSGTEALAAIWRFIGRSKIWPMSIGNLSVREVHAKIHPGEGSPCIDCSEKRLMCDGQLPCQRCKEMGRFYQCKYKIPPHDEPVWPRPPPKQITFTDELVNSQNPSSTHRIESAIAWAAPEWIPEHIPPKHAKQLKKEGKFWINFEVQRKMAAMIPEDKERIIEYMAHDKRILPLLAENNIDPVSFFVRFEVKREWQARQAQIPLPPKSGDSEKSIKK